LFSQDTQRRTTKREKKKNNLSTVQRELAEMKKKALRGRRFQPGNFSSLFKSRKNLERTPPVIMDAVEKKIGKGRGNV